MKLCWKVFRIFSITGIVYLEALAAPTKNYVIAVLDHPKKLSPLQPESNSVEIHGSLLFYPLLRSWLPCAHCPSLFLLRRPGRFSSLKFLRQPSQTAHRAAWPTASVILPATRCLSSITF